MDASGAIQCQFHSSETWDLMRKVKVATIQLKTSVSKSRGDFMADTCWAFFYAEKKINEEETESFFFADKILLAKFFITNEKPSKRW